MTHFDQAVENMELLQEAGLFVDPQRLFDVVGEWSDATFGQKGPEGSIRHLRREVKELMISPHDLEEYADCLMLLFDAARRAGYTLDDLLQGTAAKLVVNKGRSWVEPDAEGVSEHRRGPAQAVTR